MREMQRKVGDGLASASFGMDRQAGPAEAEEAEPVEIPVDGVLDLHTFRPADVGELLPEYIRLCREKGIVDLRIVHGKGTGVLCRHVHAILGRLPEVAGFRLGDESSGGWGATLVVLKSG